MSNHAFHIICLCLGSRVKSSNVLQAYGHCPIVVRPNPDHFLIQFWGGWGWVGSKTGQFWTSWPQKGSKLMFIPIMFFFNVQGAHPLTWFLAPIVCIRGYFCVIWVFSAVSLFRILNNEIIFRNKKHVMRKISVPMFT